MECFELVTKSARFWNLLIKPSSFGHWPKKGIVVFLGGDQFWSILLAKRLGYLNITYAEWIARWPQWTDTIAAMNDEVKKLVPKNYRHKCKIIGDLMADIKLESTIKFKNPEKNTSHYYPVRKKQALCRTLF